MMDIRLTYDLKFGALQAHAEGLRRGEAVAVKCGQCGLVSFPPVAVCSRCGAREAEPQVLAGSAVILGMTGPEERRFALVRFDGSDTVAVARLHGIDEKTTDRGRLMPPGRRRSRHLAGAT